MSRGKLPPYLTPPSGHYSLTRRPFQGGLAASTSASPREGCQASRCGGSGGPPGKPAPGRRRNVSPPGPASDLEPEASHPTNEHPDRGRAPELMARWAPASRFRPATRSPPHNRALPTSAIREDSLRGDPCTVSPGDCTSLRGDPCTVPPGDCTSLRMNALHLPMPTPVMVITPLHVRGD